MLCDVCPQHPPGHTWWKEHHNPQFGFKNYNQLIADLSYETKRACVQMVDAEETNKNNHQWSSSHTDGMIHQTNHNEVQVYNQYASQAIEVNGVPSY